MIQSEQWWFQIMQGMVYRLHIIQDMALRHQQVFPSIIIEIFQTCSPACARCG